MSDAEGKMVVREIATRPLTQDLLNHEVRGWSGGGDGKVDPKASERRDLLKISSLIFFVSSKVLSQFIFLV